MTTERPLLARGIGGQAQVHGAHVFECFTSKPLITLDFFQTNWCYSPWYTLAPSRQLQRLPFSTWPNV